MGAARPGETAGRKASTAPQASLHLCRTPGTAEPAASIINCDKFDPGNAVNGHLCCDWPGRLSPATASRHVSQGRQMMRPASSGAATAVLALVSAAALAACVGSSTPKTGSAVPGVYGSLPPAATGAQHAGTVSVAQPPDSAPTWILPLATSASVSVFTVHLFDQQMYRPLYWLVNGVEPKEASVLSLASDPKVSNGDKTFTVTL